MTFIELTDSLFLFIIIPRCVDQKGVFGSFKLIMQFEPSDCHRLLGISPDTVVIIFIVFIALLMSLMVIGNPYGLQSKL